MRWHCLGCQDAVCQLASIVTCNAHACVFLQGHALYYGRAQLADDYFEKMGYHLPYRVNVADFILDLASGDVSMDDR